MFVCSESNNDNKIGKSVPIIFQDRWSYRQKLTGKLSFFTFTFTFTFQNQCYIELERRRTRPVSSISSSISMASIIAILVIIGLFLAKPLTARSSRHSHSRITVVGAVYCDTCSRNAFSKHSYFLPGIFILLLIFFIHIIKLLLPLQPSILIIHLINLEINFFFQKIK